MSQASRLFNEWVKKYPDSTLAKRALKELDYPEPMGHFMLAVYHADLDTAFAHADSENLRMLEELTGIDKATCYYYWNSVCYEECEEFFNSLNREWK